MYQSEWRTHTETTYNSLHVGQDNRDENRVTIPLWFSGGNKVFMEHNRNVMIATAGRGLLVEKYTKGPNPKSDGYILICLTCKTTLHSDVTKKGIKIIQQQSSN